MSALAITGLLGLCCLYVCLGLAFKKDQWYLWGMAGLAFCIALICLSFGSKA